MDYAQHFNPTRTSVHTKVDPRQVVNSAGAFTFQVDDWKRLERFLILGNEGGTYYATEKKLTKENAQCVLRCVQLDPIRTVNTIRDISVSGRAPKNDAAIFALALVASCNDKIATAFACDRIVDVCRTATHLFQFVDAVSQFRGWGRRLRRGVARWYETKPADKLAYQVAKYGRRVDWSHADVVRLCHPQKGMGQEQHAVMRYIVDQHCGERFVNNRHNYGVRLPSGKVGYPAVGYVPDILPAIDALKSDHADVRLAVRYIQEHGLTHEMIPDKFKNSPDVWDALFEKMPITATIRNLGKMSSLGLFAPFSARQIEVAQRLNNVELLKEGRVHPMNMLVAFLTYSQGHGVKGDLSWPVNQKIVDALNYGFYASFGAVEPTNKNTLIAVDCSASMTWLHHMGLPKLDTRTAAACIAMQIARTEPNHYILGFGNGLMDIGVTPAMRLDQVVNQIARVPATSTHIGLPMVWAEQNKVPVDTFVVLTDNEVNRGPHPHKALQNHRRATGKNSKLAVLAMTATEFTVADPSDSGMMDCAGLDGNVPNVLADFMRS